MGAVLVQRCGQGGGFAQLLLIAAVFNLMHKGGHRTFRRTPGRNACLGKRPARGLGGELTTPVGQQRYQLTARMTGEGLDQMRGRFSGGRDRAGRMNNHQRIQLMAVEQDLNTGRITLCRSVIF